MYRSAAILIAFAPLAFWSCDEDRTAENPLSPHAALAVLAAQDVAIHGDFDWTFQGWQLPPEGRCPAPEEGVFWVLSTVEGTGTMSHLGQVHVFGGYCLNPFTLEFVRGEVTYVAPNGDLLTGTFVGSGYPGSAPNEVGWSDRVVFAGGAGRFVGAGGSAHEMGGAVMQFDPATGFATGGSGWGTIEGTIRYDASSRAR